MKTRLPYNAGLDGLRGVSVLAVIAYHLGVPLFSGGFVGVDVFFVLSGYLITSVLASEWEGGSFSFLAFWFRRIRRLLPAYLAMALVTLAVGYWVLIPRDFASFGQSLLYQAAFSANLLFKNEVGYFDLPAQIKPLLHTWSLAVEEQFYLFFPVLLWAALRFGRARFADAVAALAIASFAYGLVYPGSEAAAFFLPQTRVWEILVGCYLAIAQVPAAASALSMGSRQLGAWISAAAVAVPVFAYTDATHFPGWATLPPVLGTAGLIALSGQPGTVLHRLLGRPRLAALGRMSYSLYLWHWPVAVYARYLGMPVTWVSQIVLGLVTFALAAFFYRTVETPLRRQIPDKHPKAFLVGALGISLVLALTGAWIYQNGGMRERFSPAALAYAEGAQDRFAWWDPQFSRTAFAPHTRGATGLRAIGPASSARRVLFWGNSHMGHLLPAAQRLAEKYGVEVFFPAQSCPWLSTDHPSKHCDEVSAWVVQLLDQKFFQQVIWANDWRPLARREDFAARVKESMDLFSSSHTPLAVVDPIPVYSFEVPAYLALRETYPLDHSKKGQPLESHRRASARMQTVLDTHRAASVVQIDLSAGLCPGGFCEIERGGRALYSDSNHLSVFGTQAIEKQLEPVFQPKE